MNRTVAITGATGFAGRHAVDEALRRGWRVRALVRKPAEAGLPAAVELVEGDLSKLASLGALLEGADAVVHLAGAITAMRREDYFRVNEAGTVAVAEAALQAGTRRFVHISSLAAREPSLSGYAASKRAGEEAIAARADRLNAVILRPPAVYGPGDKGTLPLMKELTRAVAAIPGRRDARFSLIHVHDLARFIAHEVESDNRGLHEVSDGTSGGYGWEDLLRTAEGARGGPIRALFLPRAVPQAVALAAEAISRITGRPGMVNSGKIAELYHPDWVAREGRLALADPIAFAAGFAATLAWYRDAGWLPRPNRADRTGATS